MHAKMNRLLVVRASLSQRIVLFTNIGYTGLWVEFWSWQRCTFVIRTILRAGSTRAWLCWDTQCPISAGIAPCVCGHSSGSPSRCTWQLVQFDRQTQAVSHSSWSKCHSETKLGMAAVRRMRKSRKSLKLKWLPVELRTIRHNLSVFGNRIFCGESNTI